MKTINAPDQAATESTDQPEQTDVPVYLPGTPTLSFTNRLERLVDALRR